MEWKEAPAAAITGRDWVYAETKHSGYDIELSVRRMDDEHNRLYPSNATGWKYAWCLDTSESFYADTVGTILTSGYAMTLEEGIEAVEKAFKNIDKYRMEWKDDAKK